MSSSEFLVRIQVVPINLAARRFQLIVRVIRLYCVVNWVTDDDNDDAEDDGDYDFILHPL